MKNQRPSLSLLSLFCTLVLTSMTAQAGGLYVGAGLYQTTVDFEGLDDDDATPAFFVGYNFWDTVAKISAEIGYYDLGSYDNEVIDVDATAITAAAVGGIGIGPMFEVYAKLGFATVSADVEGAIGDFSDDETDPLFGIGASLDIFDTVDIYLEYLQVDNEIESDLIGLGVRLDF